MDFGTLPPEINSGRMYAGPGSGPMLIAAAAWDGLAAELVSAAVGYASVIAELASSSWLGPASLSMVASATPYAEWLNSVAELAEQAGLQARTAALAYETAFAMTVPPAMVAANRVLLMTLIATNFFGQYTPAIAVTEAQYGEMWAQDAAAMYGYAGSSAIASELTPFTSPAQNTNVAGPAIQAAAVDRAAVTPAASVGPSQLIKDSTVPQLLQQLSSSVVVVRPDLNSSDWWLAQRLGMITPAMRTSVFRTVPGLAYFGLGMPQFLSSITQQLTLGPGGATAGSGGAWYPEAVLGGVSSTSVNLVSAAKIGPLSVPQTWVTSTISLESKAAHTVGFNAATAGSSNGMESLVGGWPMSGTGRRSIAGFAHKYGFRHSVLIRSPSAG